MGIEPRGSIDGDEDPLQTLAMFVHPMAPKDKLIEAGSCRIAKCQGLVAGGT